MKSIALAVVAAFALTACCYRPCPKPCPPVAPSYCAPVCAPAPAPAKVSYHAVEK
jgi:hypothetical protein